MGMLAAMTVVAAVASVSVACGCSRDTASVVVGDKLLPEERKLVDIGGSVQRPSMTPWTTVVLCALKQHGGMCRTGELARSLPGCSKKMLTQTLREMEADGLLDRKVYPVVPPKVEYSLTTLGKRFLEPMEMLDDWARRNDDAVRRLKSRKKKRDKAGS